MLFFFCSKVRIVPKLLQNKITRAPAHKAGLFGGVSTWLACWMLKTRRQQKCNDGAAGNEKKQKV